MIATAVLILAGIAVTVPYAVGMVWILGRATPRTDHSGAKRPNGHRHQKASFLAPPATQTTRETLRDPPR